VLLAVSLLSLLSLAALADEPRVGDLVAGKQKSKAENCQECHGETGVSPTNYIPHLAGQHADYLVKQLQDFRSGERKHPIMNVMADGLADGDLEDIAAYFAANPPVRGDGSGKGATAERLFTRGDPGRGIPPCKSCHGENGQGSYSDTGSYPMIGGQHRVYLREQLRNWRSGERHNCPGGMMNVVTRSLSDDELESLAAYIAGLSPKAP
jgi:cytochrome c553